MSTTQILASAILASTLTPSSLPAESCPPVNFDDMKSALHDALCGLDQRSLARDAALLTEHQALVSKVSLLDSGNVTDILSTIQNFITSIDENGDGKVDGLAGLISANESLKARVEALESRATVSEQRLDQLGQQQNSTAATVNEHGQRITALENRTDKEGISEDKATEIAEGAAAAAVCKAVLAPLAAAAQSFADSIKAIDCGVDDHAAFMSSIANGSGFTPTPNGGGSGSTTDTSSETTTETTTAPATGGETPVADDNSDGMVL